MAELRRKPFDPENTNEVIKGHLNDFYELEKDQKVIASVSGGITGFYGKDKFQAAHQNEQADLEHQKVLTTTTWKPATAPKEKEKSSFSIGFFRQAKPAPETEIKQQDTLKHKK